MDILGKIPDWLGLKPRRLVVVTLTTSALLLLPQQTLEVLGLSSLVQDFKPWIGLALLFSLMALVAEGGAPLWLYVREKIKDRMKERELSAILRDLTTAEKEILASFITKGSRTQAFSAMDGVIAGLERQGILARVTTVSRSFSFHYGVQPWAWRYLRTHPEVVGITKEKLDEQALEEAAN